MTATSMYIEPPTIPAGMTIAEYRRTRTPRARPLASRVLARIRPAGPAR
jgi:hypothetical protein